MPIFKSFFFRYSIRHLKSPSPLTNEGFFINGISDPKLLGECDRSEWKLQFVGIFGTIVGIFILENKYKNADF